MNPVIKVENISKRYKLGVINRRTLADELKYRWVKFRGEDPREHLGKIDALKTDPRDSDFWALKDVSFEVNQGDIVGLIGGNGAGKSTMLKILTRITEPTSGRAVIRGRVGSLLEVGTGFHPELTGRENIYMNGTILGMKNREIEAKFDEIVDFSGVEQFLDTPVKRYSSGMYVRLAFSVAAHLEPEVLLVDEVLAVGDSEFQKKCLGKMGEIAQGGRTIVFVSHNAKAVRELCARCVWFERGQIHKSGKTDEIVTEYLTRTRGSKQVFPVINHAYNISISSVGTRTDGDDLIVSATVESSDFSQALGLTLVMKDGAGNVVFKSLDYQSGAIISDFSGSKTLSVSLVNLATLLNAGEYQIDVVVSIPEKVQLFKIPCAVFYSPPEKRNHRGAIISAALNGPLHVVSRGFIE